MENPSVVNNYFKILEEYQKYITPVYSILIYILKFSFLFGALILISYLIHIHYAPLLNFESFTTMIVLCAPVGLICVIAPLITLFYSSYLYQQLLKSPLFFEKVIGDAALYNSQIIRYEDFSAWQRAKLIGSYILSMMLGMYLIISVNQLNIKWLFGLLCFSALIGAQLGAVFYTPRKYKSTTSSVGNPFSTKSKIWDFIKMYFIWIAASCLLIFAIEMMRAFQIKDTFNYNGLLRLFVPLAFFTINGSFYLIPYKGNKFTLKAILIPTFFIVSIFFITLDIANFPNKLIKIFKIGNMSNATLVINQEGCNILSLGGYPITCKDSSYHKITNINVLWRFGEFYLKYTPTLNNKELAYYFIIPATDGWISSEEKEGN